MATYKQTIGRPQKTAAKSAQYKFATSAENVGYRRVASTTMKLLRAVTSPLLPRRENSEVRNAAAAPRRHSNQTGENVHNPSADRSQIAERAVGTILPGGDSLINPVELRIRLPLSLPAARWG